jgi:hypothetical protein
VPRIQQMVAYCLSPLEGAYIHLAEQDADYY